MATRAGRAGPGPGQVSRTDTVVIGVILLASVGLGSYMAQSAPPSK
jgi:hypothetical protein